MQDKRSPKLDKDQIRAAYIAAGLIKPSSEDVCIIECHAAPTYQQCGEKFARLARNPWQLQCGNCMHPGLSKGGRQARGVNPNSSEGIATLSQVFRQPKGALPARTLLAVSAVLAMANGFPSMDDIEPFPCPEDSTDTRRRK